MFVLISFLEQIVTRDFFRIAYTHALGGVDVPFEIYDLGPTSSGQNSLILFNIADIWRNVS